jgi:hypothetical protein
MYGLNITFSEQVYMYEYLIRNIKPDLRQYFESRDGFSYFDKNIYTKGGDKFKSFRLVESCKYGKSDSTLSIVHDPSRIGSYYFAPIRGYECYAFCDVRDDSVVICDNSGIEIDEIEIYAKSDVSISGIEDGMIKSSYGDIAVNAENVIVLAQGSWKLDGYYQWLSFTSAMKCLLTGDEQWDSFVYNEYDKRCKQFAGYSEQENRSAFDDIEPRMESLKFLVSKNRRYLINTPSSDILDKALIMRKRKANESEFDRKIVGSMIDAFVYIYQDNVRVSFDSFMLFSHKDGIWIKIDESILCSRMNASLQYAAAISKKKIDKIGNLYPEYKLYCKINKHELWMPEPNKDIIPFRNGNCYDLSTSSFRKINRTDYVVNSMNMSIGSIDEYGAIDNIFKDMLCSEYESKEVNENNYQFFKMMLGYLFTGYTSEKCLFALIGSRDNGKTMMANILKNVIGDLSCIIKPDVIIGKSYGGDTPEPSLINMLSKRVGILSELEQDMNLNVARTKQLTGGDHITARTLFAENIEVKHQAKIFIITNKLPEIENDPALQRRIKIVKMPKRYLAASEYKDMQSNGMRNIRLMDGKLEAKLLNGMRSQLESFLISCALLYYGCEEIGNPSYTIQDVIDEPIEFEVCRKILYVCDGTNVVRSQIMDLIHELAGWPKAKRWGALACKQMNNIIETIFHIEPKKSHGVQVYHGLAFRDGAKDIVSEYSK